MRVKIGPDLIQLDGQTFATKQVTSVRMHHPHSGLRLLGSLTFGLAAYIFGVTWAGGLMAFVALGCALQKSTLFIRTSGGETKAYTSVVPERVDAVHDAVVRAMVGQ